MNPIETRFPGLVGTTWSITSPKARQYNCIAWAAGDATEWWWPDSAGQEHWPAGVAREETLTAFREAFRTLGYQECVADAGESGYERIAIFADDQDVPTHAARQLPSGRWTSKLGEREDIEHVLHTLVGSMYGHVAQIMKRPTN